MPQLYTLTTLLMAEEGSYEHGFRPVSCASTATYGHGRWNSEDTSNTEDVLMLVLSRKLGQRIFIGNNVIITVVEIDQNKVRIGVSAPRSVGVWREELYVASPNSTANEVRGSGEPPAE